MTPPLQNRRQDYAEENFALNMVITACAVTSTVLVAGLLIQNRRHFKAWKKVILAQDDNMLQMQSVISTLRSSGKPFSFYPGVGVYLDKV